MEFGFIDSGNNSEHSNVGLVEIPEIFVTQDDFSYRMALNDRMYV